MEHLSKNTGLDVSQMTIDIRDVKFHGNQATAAVSFKPKSSPDAGMSMNYTLERRANKWVVQKRADSGATHGGGALPPGHPQVPDNPPVPNK